MLNKIYLDGGRAKNRTIVFAVDMKTCHECYELGNAVDREARAPGLGIGYKTYEICTLVAPLCTMTDRKFSRGRCRRVGMLVFS